MFSLKKNNYRINGVCLYEDEEQNSVFCRRSSTGFVSKLRFYDDRIKAEPLYTTIPIKEDNGALLKLHYKSEVDLEGYQSVIDSYNKIVDRWAMMCYDLEILQKRQAAGESIESSLMDLREYEELSAIIDDLSSAASPFLLS